MNGKSHYRPFGEQLHWYVLSTLLEPYPMHEFDVCSSFRVIRDVGGLFHVMINYINIQSLKKPIRALIDRHLNKKSYQ